MSFFEISRITVENDKVKYGENLKINLQFSLGGEIREVFTPDSWEMAYKEWERKFILKYQIKFKVKEGIFSAKEILSDKLVRKAVFFWTRNPTIERRIWVLIVPEDKQPVLLKNLAEIHERLFKIEKTYEISTELLGTGRHKIHAEIKARWSNYPFIKATTVKTKSNVLEIECLK